MKKSGFTMIELIFVIVIIGILAAVAIPKLAATRTDAKVASISQEAQSAVQEISNYVTAKGGEANATALTKQSQVLKQLVAQGKASSEEKNATDRNITIYGDSDSSGNGIGCVTIDVNDTFLKVEVNSSAKGQICTGVKTIVKDANYTLAGSSVNF